MIESIFFPLLSARLVPAITLHYISAHTLTLVFLRLMREYGIGVGLYARADTSSMQTGTLWLENLRGCVGEGKGRRLLQVRESRRGWC